MKKIMRAIFLFLCIFLFSACAAAEPSNYDSAATNTPEETQALIDAATPTASPEIQIPDSPSLTTADCLGVWRKAPNEKEGFTIVYSIDETGEFRRFIRDDVNYGTWSLEDNAITLTYGDDDNTPSTTLAIETANYYDVPALFLGGELYLDVWKEHIYFQEIRKNYDNAIDFTGQWKRTNVIRANAASMEIQEQTESGFQFDIDAIWAAHTGSLYDTAYLIAPNQAFYFLEPEYSDYCGVFLFTLIDDELCVEYDGLSYALPFGANVTAHGTYTKGEPSYTNANIVNEIMATEEIRERMRLLVGDTAYEQIIFVMEYGIQYIDDKYTYSGFINGIGVGVDFLIQDDGMIYCLGYWLDSPWYTFCTNDPEYKDSLPEWINIWRDKYELSFVYKDI